MTTDTPHDAAAPGPDAQVLFAFGTLLDAPVQRHVFGREVPTEPAALAGYRLVDVHITDPAVIAASGSAVHRGLARHIGGAVDGGVLRLTDEQLAAADEYEVADYARRRVHLTDGTTAWAYLAADPLVAAERLGIVGDSLAYGRCDPAGGWAARLGAWHTAREEPRYRAFALGIPGTTLRGLRSHAPQELAVRTVDTVLICAGINDLAGVDGPAAHPTDVVREMAALCEELEAQDRRPVPVGPLWLDAERAARELGLRVGLDAVEQYRAELLRWAAATNRDLLDPWDALAGRSDLLADGVHPTAEGHEVLWEWLRPDDA